MTAKDATSGAFSYRHISGDPMQARFIHIKNGLTVIL